MQHYQSTPTQSHAATREPVRAQQKGSITAENQIERIITTFEPISLQEMDAVALLNRTDTKFVLSARQLAAVLRSLRYRYRVLEINTLRLHHYSTLYFDTRDFELYHNHVTGRAEIYKVRSREYLDTRLSYLEVKHKNQKKRTDKKRLPIPFHADGMNHNMQAFLDDFLPVECTDLEPKLWNTFRRITLVSKTDLERVTIDIDLCFYNAEKSVTLQGVAVAEVKRDNAPLDSAFVAEMRRQGVRQMGFSKYCIGVAQLYDNVKKNALKEKFHQIDKILH